MTKMLFMSYVQHFRNAIQELADKLDKERQQKSVKSTKCDPMSGVIETDSVWDIDPSRLKVIAHLGRGNQGEVIRLSTFLTLCRTLNSGNVLLLHSNVLLIHRGLFSLS